MTKKRMIEILYLVHDFHKIDQGVCTTMRDLYFLNKIYQFERTQVINFLFDNFSFDKGYVYWLTSEETGSIREFKGTKHRKNILLDAIAYVSVTGRVE